MKTKAYTKVLLRRVRHEGSFDVTCVEYTSVARSSRLGSNFTVMLPTDRWVEFGGPDQITVRIEPGDRLNP